MDYVISAQNITKDFDGFRAVDGLSLQVKKGEVFGFLGPNGAGKTTSINMIVGLLKPTSGQILINGEDVQSIDKGLIGICPQELVLWDNLTCKESLTLMGDMYEVPQKKLKQRVDKLSDRVAIIDNGQLIRLDTPENLKKEIGEGDVVEMKLSKPQMNLEVIKSLESIRNILSVFEVDGLINLRAMDAVGKLPQIMEKVESNGVQISDLNVRQNTLEDVFIELTGSRLRE